MVCVLPNMDVCVCDFAYVIFELKLCFDHELKIEKMAVSVSFLNFNCAG